MLETPGDVVLQICGWANSLFLAADYLRVAQRGYQGHSADNISQQRGKEEIAEVSAPGNRLNKNEIEHCRRAGDDVVKSAEADQVIKNDNDTDPCSFRGGQKPYHQGYQPSGEYVTHKHDSETRAQMGHTDFHQCL